MAGTSPAPRKPRPHRSETKRAAEVKSIQAAAERAQPPGDVVEFHGKTYKISSSVGIWPLMQFARAAESGIDTRDYRALAALHAFLQDCLDPEDWGRFQDDMIAGKISDPDELLNMATSVVEKVTSRPTQPQSGSSNGQPAASAGSTASSSSQEALA